MRVMKRMAGMACIVACVAANAGADETARFVQSLAFPGMGQLGDEQVIKGLSIMGAEVLLLTMTFDQVGKYTAYSRDTRYLKVQFNMAETYDEKVGYYENWEDSYSKSQTAWNQIWLYGGLAAGWWVLNLVDALLFAPVAHGPADTNGGETSATTTSGPRMAFGPGEAYIGYELSF